MSTSMIRLDGHQRALLIFLGLTMTVRLSGFGADDLPGRAAESETDLQRLSKVGRGQYVPLRLKRLDEKHVYKFETSFEECAPGRNSGANEWSAFRRHRQHGLQRHGPRALGALPGLRAGVPPARRKLRRSSPASWRASVWAWSTTVCPPSGAAGSTAGCSTRSRR